MPFSVLVTPNLSPFTGLILVISGELQGLIITIFLVAFLSLISVILVLLLVVFNRRKSNEFLAEKQQLEAERQRQVLNARIEMQESTLHTLTQEIHDNVGQLLSLALMNLRQGMEGGSERFLLESEQNIQKTMEEIRTLNKIYHPDFVLADGLVPALQREIDLISRTGRIQASFETEGTGDLDLRDKNLLLIRMVQECLHNSIKHAEARSVSLKIQFSQTRTQIRIDDNGRGFDPDKIEKRGMGLRNLRERAAIIPAEFQLLSQPGLGTHVTITIPHETHSNPDRG